MSDSFDDIIRKIRSNSKEENKKLAEEMKSALTDEQSRSLNALISNRELMKKLMESDEAKNIMKKLGGDGNGHK